nr:hypothetical protein HAGR004_10810 [Bdellovibrio sp. HAGR004]
MGEGKQSMIAENNHAQIEEVQSPPGLNKWPISETKSSSGNYLFESPKSPIANAIYLHCG